MSDTPREALAEYALLLEAVISTWDDDGASPDQYADARSALDKFVMTALAALAEAPAVPVQGTFWLIERGPNQGEAQHWWWSRAPKIAAYGAPHSDWTRDVHKATRFATQDAAEQAARDDYVRAYAVTSHSFMAALAEAPAMPAIVDTIAALDAWLSSRKAGVRLTTPAGFVITRPADLTALPTEWKALAHSLLDLREVEKRTAEISEKYGLDDKPEPDRQLLESCLRAMEASNSTTDWSHMIAALRAHLGETK